MFICLEWILIFSIFLAGWTWFDRSYAVSQRGTTPKFKAKQRLDLSKSVYNINCNSDYSRVVWHTKMSRSEKTKSITKVRSFEQFSPFALQLTCTLLTTFAHFIGQALDWRDRTVLFTLITDFFEYKSY